MSKEDYVFCNPSILVSTHCISEYRSYKVGIEFLSTLDLDFSQRWRGLSIYAMFIVSDIVLLLNPGMRLSAIQFTAILLRLSNPC